MSEPAGTEPETAGYDALTGAAVVLLGCGIGIVGSTVNPFATGIASGIAGVSISDGLVGPLVILIAGLAIGIFFVMPDVVRWLLVLATALLVIGLIAYARGPNHHHGDDIGAHAKG
jgi:hypothetical protein